MFGHELNLFPVDLPTTTAWASVTYFVKFYYVTYLKSVYFKSKWRLQPFSLICLQSATKPGLKCTQFYFTTLN